MELKRNKKLFFIIACQLLFAAFINMAAAQRLQYCNENVYINNPDNLQLVANVKGNHHLLSFNNNENPMIFIYNSRLQLQQTIKAPFKFPERSDVRLIRFDNFYYLYIHPRFNKKYQFWKIDADGNFTDFTALFQKLLASQSQNIKLGFQLIANQQSLWMVYHTDIDNVDKNTVVVAQTDSLLNVVYTHTVLYDFKRHEEKLHQQVLMFGKYLLVLKSTQSGTSLEMMKVYLNTGYTISNTFSSSGYFYSQPSFNYNTADSSIAISALLTEPRTTDPKRFVFASRLNNLLVEQVPFSILKNQYKKNTATNFLLVDGLSQWVRLRVDREQGSYFNQNNVNPEPDLTTPGANAQNIGDNISQQSTFSQSRVNSYAADARQPVRFSLLNKNLELIKDSLVLNGRDSYTIRPDQFMRFVFNGKEYMLVGQQFAKRSRGLLMVSNIAQQLSYTDIRVMPRNDYLLNKAQVLSKEGIIVPYIHKLEAGLVKIVME